MSAIGVSFVQALDGVIPVYAAVPRASEALASSAASARTTIAASGIPGEVARVTAVGGAVWVSSGSATPTAVVGTGFLVPDGGTVDLGRLQAGWTIAVIDA